MENTEIARERHKNCIGIAYMNAPEINITADVCEPDGYLHHAWEECIGSPTPYLYITTEKNYAEQIYAHLKDVHKNLGMKRVYFDKVIANEPYITTYTEDENGEPSYNWEQVDRIYNMILEAGMKPFVMIAAIPKALASDPENTDFDGGNSSAPKDYDKWKEFCKRFVSHLIEVYGEDEVCSWVFQIMNEYDIRNLYWSGTNEEYYKTYDYAATGIKEVHPRIKVGPGGFAFTHGHLVASFMDHVSSFNYDPAGDPAGAPFDFINSHAYCLWDGRSLKKDFDKLERYLISRFGPDHGKEFMMSEWNTDAGAEPSPIHDSEMNAAFIVRQVTECSKDFFNKPNNRRFFAFWCHSDVYDELGEIEGEFSGLFGLITPNGIHKPNYNAFKMLHGLGNSRIAVFGGSDDLNGIATYNKDKITLVIYNCKYDILRWQGDENLNTLVNFKIQNIPWPKSHIEHYRIDRNHSNAYTVWKEMGCPGQCNREQIEYLRSRMDLEYYDACREVDTHTGIYKASFEMPMPSVSMLIITPTEEDFVKGAR